MLTVNTEEAGEIETRYLGEDVLYPFQIRDLSGFDQINTNAPEMRFIIDFFLPILEKLGDKND